MKKQIMFAAFALLALSVHAQNLPLPTCITNIVLTLTDTNSWLHDTGGSVTNVGGSAATVTIDYHGCNTNPVVIGNLFLQCDVQRHCQNNENIWSCPSGSIIQITLPPLCDGITITFSPNGGCCDAAQVNSNPQACVPQDSTGPQPQP